MRRYFTFCILLLLQSHVRAQVFGKEGKIDQVQTDGFYKIPLKPGITTYLKEDYSDIRILDDQGKEVPYILQSETPQESHELFKEYKIEEKIHVQGCCTTIILENPGKNKINNISLIIKNAQVHKQARLSGSDNRKEWYVVRERIYLESITNDHETFEVKILDFPLTDYQYYKLEIADSSSAPLNIIKAGYYDVISETGKYQELPNAILQQKDSSDKKSYLSVSFSSPQYIDRLKIRLKGPVYYRRPVSISIPEKSKGRTILRHVLQGELRSNSENIFTLDHLKATTLYLVVENHDNPPLTIEKAEGLELIRYLVAYLEKDKNYSVKFSNPAISYPQYDLEFFRDNIPASTPELAVKDILSLTAQGKRADPEFFRSVWWIWAAIIVVAILLGYMTLKMIREMKKE